MTPDNEGLEQHATPPEMRASKLVRIRSIWVTPVLVASVLIFLMSLIYVGSVVDPVGHLRGLPVLVVNEDAGAEVQSQHLDVGQKLVSALDQAPAVTSRLSLRTVTMAEAESRMDNNEAYVAIVVPPQFTASLLSLYASAPANRQTTSLPTVELLTNGRAGSIGVSLASGVANPALTTISEKLAQQLSTQPGAGAPTGTAIDTLRADPVTVTSVPYRPLPSHSALGLSAFYVSLLVIMCGFLGATLVNSTIDAALGFATNEIGPKWRLRIPVPITRWQTLLAKWIVAAAVVPVLVAVLLLVSIGLLGMDTSHIFLLWVFSAFAGIVVATGTLVFFAAFGLLGQLLAMLVFVYLALASSGGTIPIQALSGVLLFAAGFEPLRQVLGGVRSILYFNATASAGLTRGFVMAAVGLAIWIVLGSAVTLWYDRKGLYRIPPELMAYVHRSVEAYTKQKRTALQSPVADDLASSSPLPRPQTGE